MPSPASGNIGTAYEFGPGGITFNQPVTISIAYDEVALPPGTQESNLKLATITNNQWRIVTSLPADTSANVVNGTTTHFSTYGVKASRLSQRAQELLIGDSCSTLAISCISLRVHEDSICKGECTESIADMLLGEGITVLGSAPNPSILLSSQVEIKACVGFSVGIGGTREGAQFLVDLLGPSYRLDEETFIDGIICNVDGFPYSVHVE